jgi:hypothetical protein
MSSFAPLFLLLAAALLVLTVIFLTREKPVARARRAAPATVVEPAVVEEVKAPEPEVATIYDDKVAEVNFAFPKVDANDVEAEFAGAYTYENLQESLLSSGVEARGAVKTRAAYSRLGARSNPKQFDENMETIKAEILASGQSLETFMDNAWMPIPEQMAALLKDTSSSVPEPSNPIVRGLSREAQAEAADLIRSSTQDIPAKAASARFVEVINARKRAKSLGVPLPELTKQQKAAINRSLGDSELSGLARTLQSL